ncbi:hypothetical protein KFL_011110030 [Klebsormidium nitens]|uniref:RING-type domain-containing protein n=1 Tax=Klebsormidium nitens TaxID=105231 RepID=A0A1Y1IT53_KLENI|nr:hypothetical protein KFL_011110030 [Klebsormidium nitens]|eukprot:GAQ92729.1 hypothetical protein KFL_011110030 [Klebsormidium nitens]
MAQSYFVSGPQQYLISEGRLYVAATPLEAKDLKATSSKRRRVHAESSASLPVSPDSLVQSITSSVTASVTSTTQLLLKQLELDDALVWSQTVKLAAGICSSRPGILVQALQKCESRVSLLDDIASIFIDSLAVHPSPLGPLPPLHQWPAPCLIIWEVEGSTFIHPLICPTSSYPSLDSYLGEVNDPTHLQEQLNAWLRYWKPLFPRYMWPTMRAALASQKEKMYKLGVGQSLEHTAKLRLHRAKLAYDRRRATLGDFTDETLQNLEDEAFEKQFDYDDLLLANRGLLDWYRSTSFFLTGRTTSTACMGGMEYPAVNTLEASLFGADCLPTLQEDTSPFFGVIGVDDKSQVFAPVWGMLMAWVAQGGLQEWLPQAESFEESLRLLREREIKKVWDIWASTPNADSAALLKGWMEGPGAVFPAMVANMQSPPVGLPPVHEEAAIHAQLRATNPARGDCRYKLDREALYGWPRMAACALCGMEDVDQLSSLYSSCAHTICSVCYTVTHQASSINGPPQCAVRCGGSGHVNPEPRHDPATVIEFSCASLS